MITFEALKAILVFDEYNVQRGSTRPRGYLLDTGTNFTSERVSFQREVRTAIT